MAVWKHKKIDTKEMENNTLFCKFNFWKTRVLCGFQLFKQKQAINLPVKTIHSLIFFPSFWFKVHINGILIFCKVTISLWKKMSFKINGNDWLMKVNYERTQIHLILTVLHIFYLQNTFFFFLIFTFSFFLDSYF